MYPATKTNLQRTINATTHFSPTNAGERSQHCQLYTNFKSQTSEQNLLLIFILFVVQDAVRTPEYVASNVERLQKDEWT
jgi:hypothetical protein